MATADTTEEMRRGVDHTERGGSIGLVLLVALVLVGAAIGFLFIGRGAADVYILSVLAALATFGVFALFAYASGILRLSDRETGNPVIRAVADEAFDGIVVTDAAGRVLYANAAYLELVDATDPRDVRPVERVFIGDPDVSEAIYRLLKASREGRRQQEEVRVPGLNGEPARWLRLRVRPLGGGRIARSTVWNIADVTRDRERQENVFQELQHAIDYLDHAPAGFFSVDPSGNIIYLNATLAGWLDHDLAQVGSGGLRLSQIMSGDGASQLMAITGTPGDVKTQVLDLDMKMRNGRSVPVRLFHKVAFGADGVAGTSRTLVLNRARDGAPDPQRAAEVRFMRFFNNTPMAIATVDRDGKVASRNGLFATLFHGLLRDGAGETASILSVVAERDRAPLLAAIGKAAAGQGDIAPVEAELAGSRERSASFYVTAIQDEESENEVAIVYALETTDKRTLEKAINQQQKMDMVGQVAGGMAHDFNNLLSSIMMATDFLLIAHKPTDPSFKDIDQIRQNANRAASLVRHLLAFSRKQTLRPQVLNLGEVLDDLMILLRRLIGEKIKPDVKHSRDLWLVKADLSQFEQVIINLAVNARDAMPEGGSLTIRTKNVDPDEVARFAYKGLPPAEYVLIEVEDTGTGIPPDIREKIFEPFFTTKDVGKGTGLGLSTVYGIVKQTGGFVYLESDVGKGTLFRIFIPRHIPRAEPELERVDAPAIAGALAAAGEMAQLAQPDLTGRGTILLVEDEEGLRTLNARGLASRGYTVIEAGNGIEAIEKINESGAVDLVVSDVVMPEMDGPTMLNELRKTNPDLKIIFVSGYAEEAFEKNLPAGGYEFLAKPFTLRELISKVKDVMAQT